ncbi:hypothetical protein AXE80_10075 [Wenyingzhuangia fucanilytica]|uniref:Glycosyltransferase RgtA/B/C/D-like domain-containing protein n=1 Tax=Wenyingzhuangia fucanilytica TaxID=1790137 RepID=A0A1B1Y745_9FLAO|nr:hypothetical protein [Wenyingzhuangia fucanilytica]ANW96601.1 hypothetical protein AXE80_10075 [Wenyingzhuangia fucanilytica]
MDKINSRSSIFVFFIIWFAYLAFFSFATIVIRENGYLNFEPLYITSHINTLFRDGELVKNFFLSYPLLTNLLAYPFSFFSAEDAPFFASVLYTSFFSTCVVTIVGNQSGKVLKTLLFLYLLFSPITFYAATSGTSLYAFYILYFLIFYYLLNYIKQFTTYHITILSIILSLAVFLDYRILWVLLILFFYVFVFTVYGIKGLESNTIIKFVKITQHNSLRRKFRGHLNSMVFIIGFFPVVSLLLYLFINYLMGSDFYYFYNVLGAKWNSNKFLSLLDTTTLTAMNNKAVNDFSFLRILVFIAPIYFYELIVNYKNELKVFVLLLAPVLLYVLVRDSKIEYMGLFYYVILVSSAIASITTANYKNAKNKNLRNLSYACLFIGCIYGEYFYFKQSLFSSEQIFYKSVVEKENNKVLSQYKNGGRFLAFNTPENSIVLCDRSIMYPLLAYNKKNNLFISNTSEEYKMAISNPKKYCDYIIISNIKSPHYFYDKIEINFKELSKTKLGYNSYKSKVIYVCDAFRIIEVIK